MRSLLWAASGYTAALLAAYYLLPHGLLAYAALAAGLLLALSLPALRGKPRRRAVIALAAATAGFLWAWGYAELFVLPADRLVGECRVLTLRVADYPRRQSDYSRVEAVADGEDVTGTRMLIYDYSDYGLDALRPGDVIEAPVKLLSARTYYGEADDYYLSGGVRLRGYLTGEPTSRGRWNLSLLYLPKELSKRIGDRAMICFPPDTAPLMKALLTGDRTEYYQDPALSAAFQTAGLSHVVAVSGMHVAFLLGLLRLLTGRRRVTAFLGIPLVLGYMAMMGFTPSVTRAGLFQILLLAGSLLRREADMPTALGAALLVLLLPNPAAVGNLSLQFSFAAMAGMALVSSPVFQGITQDERGRDRLPKKLVGAVLRRVAGAFSATVGAMLFTVPLAALHSGFVPLYSFLTNLLCLWPVSVAFACGYPVCLLGLAWPRAGAALGWAVSWLTRYVCFIVRQIAALPLAALSTRHNLGAWWLAFVYVMFLLCWLLRERDEKFRPTFPICGALCTLSVLSLCLRSAGDGLLTVAAVDVGQGSCTVALTDTAAVMIDCGGGGTADNAGDRAADYLLENGRDRLDLLILTHFHADHANGVTRLLGRVGVKRLVMAASYQPNDYSGAILDACQRNGTEVYTVDADRTFTLDDLALTVYAPLGVGDPNEECLLIYGDYGDFEFLTTGDAGGDVERLLTVLHDLGDMELLVAGHHGSKTSVSPALLDDVTPEAAFISAGAGNRYGHPAPEVLERLRERDIRVYRTDLEGTVSVTVKKEG